MSMEKQAKNWRHYVARDTGECTVVRPEGKRERTSYQLGIVETGSSRVFAGYFITVTLSEDEEITGEDSGSLVAALWRLARNVSARGLRLRCAGMCQSACKRDPLSARKRDPLSRWRKVDRTRAFALRAA